MEAIPQYTAGENPAPQVFCGNDLASLLRAGGFLPRLAEGGRSGRNSGGTAGCFGSADSGVEMLHGASVML